MRINFDINLTKKQQEAYNIIHKNDCRFLVARWSRQCGKTIFAEIMLIEYLCKPNTFNAYISPTFSQGKKVFAELTQLLDGTGIVKKSNAADLKIESIYESKFINYAMKVVFIICISVISLGFFIISVSSFNKSKLKSTKIIT